MEQTYDIPSENIFSLSEIYDTHVRNKFKQFFSLEGFLPWLTIEHNGKYFFSARKNNEAILIDLDGNTLFEGKGFTLINVRNIRQINNQPHIWVRKKESVFYLSLPLHSLFG